MKITNILKFVAAFSAALSFAACAQTYQVQNLQVLGTSQMGTSAHPTAGNVYPTIGTTAALEALPAATFATVTRLGYYAPGDAPPLNYVSSSAPCSLNSGAGDGGSQLPSSDGNCWLAQFPPGAVNVLEFGAKPDGATNDTTFMQSAHNTGKLVYYPAGNYFFTTLTFSSGGITGDGYDSALYSTDTSSADIVTFTGVGTASQLPTFSNFSLQDGSTKTGGAGIHFSPGASNTVPYIHVNQVYLYGFPIGIRLTNSEFGTIANSIILNYSVAGVYYEFPENTAAGDFSISTTFFNTPYSTGNGIEQVSGGGLRILGNKFLGGNTGYTLAYSGTSASGPLLITGNSIENQSGFSIYLGTSSTGSYGGVVISGNELGVLNNTAGANISTDANHLLQQLSITGNYLQFNGANGTGMYLNGVQGFDIGPNLITGNNSAGNVGINIVGGSAGKVAAQQFFNFISSATTLSNTSSSVIPQFDTQVTSTAVTTSAGYGSLYTGSATVTFPLPFTSIPTVTCSVSDTAHGAVSAGAYNIGKTGFTLAVFGALSGGATTGNVCVASGTI